MSPQLITITQKGNFNKTEAYLNKLKKENVFKVLEKYGSRGVDALSNATPTDTGRTANSWYFTVEQRRGYYSIRWHNRHVVKNQVIAILIEYGHATGNGGYVRGREYIMPAIRPIFDQMANEAWKEVT